MSRNDTNPIVVWAAAAATLTLVYAAAALILPNTPKPVTPTQPDPDVSTVTPRPYPASRGVARTTPPTAPTTAVTQTPAPATPTTREEQGAVGERQLGEAHTVRAGAGDTTQPWAALAACESSGDWQANTGNGFYGGLQFTLTSWRAVGGTGYPHTAPVAEQIRRAQLLQRLQGWGAWPACSAEIGLP